MDVEGHAGGNGEVGRCGRQLEEEKSIRMGQVTGRYTTTIWRLLARYWA